MSVSQRSPANLLEVQDLATEINTSWGSFRPVDGVSFAVKKGRTLSIVGESGCGKSVTALSIMGLLPPESSRIVAGSIKLEGRNILDCVPDEMRRLRGGRMGMIFQEPMTSLNPVMKIGDQITEGLTYHGHTKVDLGKKAIELLERVGIPAPSKRVSDFPHQLSGGMRQRVMIAMALACNPSLLIADEPTTALDVTIQAQILLLLQKLQAEEDMGVILITHDFGVVAQMAHDVAVMYAGRVIEIGSIDTIFSDPLHPYTVGLLGSIARLDQRQPRLESIAGQVPPPSSTFKGCRFVDRCPIAGKECRASEPILDASNRSHAVACWKAPF